MLRTLRRPARRSVPTIEADICVVGAGMSGVSAALEAARLGRRVVIVDAAPALGGQAVGSIIGTIIGLYTHGEKPYQLTHGIADDLVADLIAEGSMHRRQSATGTITFLYDEVRLGRWIEKQVEAADIQVLVGAVMTGVTFENRRLRAIDVATRFGAARIDAAEQGLEALGYVVANRAIGAALWQGLSRAPAVEVRSGEDGSGRASRRAARSPA